MNCETSHVMYFKKQILIKAIQRKIENQTKMNS